MNYIQISCVLVYYIVGHFLYYFFVSIIGCHNCSHSAILNRFLYLQIQLYDTFSLSLSFMCIGYCAIELRSHGIHKGTGTKDLCAVQMLLYRLEPCLLR